MHPHPRHSPRTASAANNLQTNPTRTNNQRDPLSERSSPYSDTLSYGDRSVDDGEGEMVTRAQQPSESEQKNNQKVNQVIQVRTWNTALLTYDLLTLPPELLYQIRPDHHFLSRHPTSQLQQERRTETKQMGTWNTRTVVSPMLIRNIVQCRSR